MHHLPRRPAPRWLAVGLVAALVVIAARDLSAQAIAGPRPSVLWTAAPGLAPSDSTQSQGWTQSKGALAGGLIGAAAGAAAGYWACQRFSSGGADRGCSGNALWGGALFGALGLLLGALAGHDAED
jgi:hypothetical protein